MQFFYRSNLLHVLLAVFIFLFYSIKGSGENSLDELLFLSSETNRDIEKKLQDGYRAFIVSGNSFDGTTLDETDSFLRKNPNEIITLILQSESPGFIDKLKHHQVKSLLAIPEKQSLNDIENCLINGKRLFVFTPEETPYSYSIQDNICNYKLPSDFPSKISKGFGAKPDNDMVIFHIDHVISLLADSLKLHPEKIPELFNAYTGKLPNFFVTQNQEIYSAYQEAFSKKKWYTANVEYNQKPLQGVQWKEMPHMTSFGKIHTTKGELSPYKDGFHFSPDVFTYNKNTSESTKIFYARPKDIKDEMVLHLAFNQNTNNLIGEDIEIPYNNVKYTKDPERGWCGVFNDPENYIDFDTEIVFDENFTVSAWVNPKEISDNRSIIGKGKALSIKFKDGRMLFTSPGIKDHFTDSAVVVPGVWQHLTYVISSGNNVKFYKNGELVDEQIAERIEPTEHSLLIGTNLWDESFKGLMDDLVIWNRNLSDEEVSRLYHNGIENKTKPVKKSIYWASIFILALFLVLATYFTRRKLSSKRPFQGIKFLTTEEEIIEAPSIEFFGGFKITNREKEDITSRFSPRRKQIFILVLIETLKSKGITSKQLTNLLWAGHTAESAKNNRSTHVQRIREILSNNTGINISFSDKRWTVNLDDDVYCDLVNYFLLLEEFKNEKSGTIRYKILARILPIIEKGLLLPNMDDEWLDEFKSKLSDDLLDSLMPLYNDQNFINNPELTLRLSNAILIFDPLNETVLKHKIESLIKLGKNSQANESLEHFEKVYQQCYAEPFNKSISELISSN